MPLYKRLFKSLYSPKYIAASRLLGIGTTIQYLFILSFILCLPSCLSVFTHLTAGSSPAKAIESILPTLAANEEFTRQTIFIYIPVVLLFYYILLSFGLFLKAAVFAGIGLFLVFIRSKRGEYRHLFRLSTHALTLSVFVTVLMEWANWTFSYAYAADWLIVTIMLYLSIRWLPHATR
ncbi:DUF1189 domain-containing protein [Domibacillus indicus]|uniref:DUF1189 family protein n=1 Tax=Domibacillus indicus TaxID=1437523 RepID=UPI00203BF7B9|nr:DUF1189 family protein [Domibacillus indicus]MCM3788440.1 DUF1189 domain-containing protein [Domibacillus indicus]